MPYLLPLITHLLNTILKSGCFASMWRHAKIILTSKQKINLDRLLFYRSLHSYGKTNVHSDVLPYRPKHNSITALIDVADIDNNQKEILVSLDHSKAFDTVDDNVDARIILNGELIEIVKFAKNLGISFHNTLSWSV